MAKTSDPLRTYGMADPSNKQPRPKDGLRGEKAAPRQTDAWMVRSEDADGRPIAIEEESGVAFAEATGAAGLADEKAPAGERPVTPRSLMLAVGAGALLGTMWGLLRRAREPAAEPTPVAFAHPATSPQNFDQTRDAGPENIRDICEGAEWDVVDETSDESFPASDPPSLY